MKAFKRLKLLLYKKVLHTKMKINKFINKASKKLERKALRLNEIFMNKIFKLLIRV